MPEILWNPSKAGQIGNLQGQMTGYVAGLYSIPGMANISAASTEVLNQNGYTVYQDTDTGHYELKRDNYPNNNSIWTSQSMGVTLDCTGDKLVLKGMNEEESKKEESKEEEVNATLNSFGFLSTPSAFNYNSYTNDARSSFALTSQNVLNRLNAAQTSGTSYSSTVGLNNDETIDPLTHGVIDKEKSAKINELNTSEATKHKFDNIAKLINKVAEKQNKAEIKAKDKTGDCVAAGAVAVGVTGAAIGAKIGGTVGSFIPVPVVGTLVGAAAGALIGWGASAIVNSSDEAKAEKLNNEAVQEAQEAGADLKEALEGLSEEELIAFQRYYYEQSGVKITDVLKNLETDEDSSEIAQSAGFDSGYLSGMFENIDSANETLKPDEYLNETLAGNNYNKSSVNMTTAEVAQMDVLEQNKMLLRDYWQAALQNGGSIEMNGKIKTADELAQMYIEASAKYDEYEAELSEKLQKRANEIKQNSDTIEI